MSVIDRLRLMVQLVEDLVFDSDGNFTAKGADDENIGGTVGYHFGFYSRPNDGTRGVLVKADGQGNTSFLFAWRDKQYELSLEKGEVGIQNAFSATILLNADGEIVMNGGTAQVARVGDATAGHTHAFALTCPNTGTGVPATITGSITSATDTINEGADKVLA
jgi:phage gp45-like